MILHEKTEYSNDFNFLLKLILSSLQFVMVNFMYQLD